MNDNYALMGFAMLKSLFSSADRIVNVVLVAAVLMMVYSNSAIKTELEQAQARTQQIKNNFEQKQLEVTWLKDSLALSDKQNQKLLSERELLNKLNEQQTQRLSAIERALSSTQSQLAKLRQSNDTHTQSWATNCVPFAVISMFEHATAGACDQHSSEDSVSLRDHAKPIPSALHSESFLTDGQHILSPIRSRIGSYVISM